VECIDALSTQAQENLSAFFLSDWDEIITDLVKALHVMQANDMLVNMKYCFK
jgi:hypothetical protein